jgi:hypothetical protein
MTSGGNGRIHFFRLSAARELTLEHLQPKQVQFQRGCKWLLPTPHAPAPARPSEVQLLPGGTPLEPRVKAG